MDTPHKVQTMWKIFLPWRFKIDYFNVSRSWHNHGEDAGKSECLCVENNIGVCDVITICVRCDIFHGRQHVTRRDLHI